MHVAVIGAGKIGATVATGLAQANHSVAIAGLRPLGDLAVLAQTLGVSGSGSVVDCVELSEVVVLSLPFGPYITLPVAPFAGRVVIDAMNYWRSRDGANARLESREFTSSELVQEHFPDSKVVKGLNTMKWELLRDGGRTKGDPNRLVLPMSGDDVGALSIAAELVEDLGFEPVRAGSLREGGLHQQPGGRLHGAIITSSTWDRSGLATIEESPREC